MGRTGAGQGALKGAGGNWGNAPALVCPTPRWPWGEAAQLAACPGGTVVALTSETLTLA